MWFIARSAHTKTPLFFQNQEPLSYLLVLCAKTCNGRHFLRASAPVADASPSDCEGTRVVFRGSNAASQKIWACLSVISQLNSNRATESPESCKLLALKIELGSRLAAGVRRVRRRLPETSAPMVICAAGLSPVRGLPHRKRPLTLTFN